VQAYEGRIILKRMVFSRKALEARFFSMAATSITMEDCKAHIAERRKAGVKDGTIHTELSHLTNHRVFCSTGALLDIKPTAGPFQP
jgi:hypothetical protein